MSASLAEPCPNRSDLVVREAAVSPEGCVAQRVDFEFTGGRWILTHFVDNVLTVTILSEEEVEGWPRLRLPSGRKAARAG